MSEQSKDLSDPNFAAEVPDCEMQDSDAVPVGIPPPASLAANLAGPPCAPEGPMAAQQASPPPEERIEDVDPDRKSVV